jgi:GNAT superfamily N-acetyltransferase
MEKILAGEYCNSITFAPYNLIADREFLSAAHTETFALTFKQEIKQEWLDAELKKPRDVRDGAYLNGRLVGICDLQRRSQEGLGDYCRVNFYYIAPEYRNHGLGGQLIAHSVDWCRKQGLKTLTLNTAKDNFAAQRCYENNGFVRFPEIDYDYELGYIKTIV